MSLYSFKPSDAYDFSKHVGIEAKTCGDELIFSICPYCRAGAKDNQKKFSINLKTGQFQCWRASCGAKGNMITLSRDFDFSLGRGVDEYYNNSRKKYRSFKRSEPIIPKEPAIKYLESRGISEEITKKYEITTQTEHDNILVFPFYDEKGTMWFVKYRKMDFDKERDANKEWCEKDCKPILFGMKQCNPSNGTLILTEGQLDSLSVSEAGIENAVSVPNGAKGFTWVPHCWDFLTAHSELIVFGDYEKDAMTLLPEMKKRFSGKIKAVREEDYKGCKDANELLQKYGKEVVKAAVENAEPLPVKKFIWLSDVESVDIYKLDKLKTGISQLDKLLYGGIPFGIVCLIAGVRGQGKSTFASQILVNAVDQGYVSMAYSGELPNYLYRSWFDFQVAGANHIVEQQRPDGTIERFITNPNLALIQNWYSRKAGMYDNTIVDSDEKDDLLKLIEEAIKQYGIKVILIDNLMTAIYLDGENKLDKYDRQGEFVRKLTVIAMRYDVLILLVVHRRKSQGFKEDINDEVSGASDITNLAGLVLNYDKYSDKEIEENFADESDRKLTVSKNRIFGKTDFKGIKLYYQEKSKRIYGKDDNVNREYGWLPEDEFKPIENDWDKPFF